MSCRYLIYHREPKLKHPVSTNYETENTNVFQLLITL
jgi:hypothetical protein